MKDAGPAPTPDPKIGEAALKQSQLGEQWLAFSKDAFAVSQTRQAELDELVKTVSAKQMALADEQSGYARADRQRYETTFKPLEDAFVETAKNYDSPERQAQAAAEAKGDVQSAAAGARAMAQREATGLGVNPNSGRFAGIARAGETGTALATAGAQNAAREGVRTRGLALKSDAINLGRGLPTQSAQAAAMGMDAQNSAVGLTGNANQQYVGSTSIVGQGFGGAQAGYGSQAGILQGQHDSNLSAWRTQVDLANEQNKGIGKAIGTGLGLILSDEDVKTNKAGIPEGEALEAVKEMPVETWNYEEGIDGGEQHVGTYAQDFQKQTGRGDGRTIPVGDAIGLTMKAVQDLDAKITRIEAAVGLGAPKPMPPANDDRMPAKPARRAAGAF